MTFCQNDCNDLCISPQHYMEKMVESYKWMFNENPLSKANSPLDSNNQPEVDTSEFLDEDGIQQHQSLIGSMEWAISIGHFDIAVYVMSMSSFRTSPRHGHLDWAKCMVSYLSKFWLAKIQVLMDEPDYSDVERIKYDWTKSVYGDVPEIIPKDIPPSSWRLHHTDSLSRCKPAPWHYYRSLSHWYPALHEEDAYRLVL